MTRAVLLVLSLTLGCAEWLRSGSLRRDACTHVGLRPADLTMVDDSSDGTGLSLRVSTDAPECREIYPDAGRMH